MAMRKLREAIVASSRMDDFAKMVYCFIIRTTILLAHPESYYPALLHLIRRMQSARLLNNDEVKEYTGYYTLDLACRQHDLVTAFHVRNMSDHRSGKIDAVLMALVHGNWVLFNKAKGAGDPYEQRLMEWASERMTDNALQCLGKSYVSVGKEYVERCTGMRWDRLKEEKKVPWQCGGQTIMIKQTMKK
ncbi:MAG: hypothetical protein Q9209_005194 [Squamulea sp. 1 TL-2023]